MNINRLHAFSLSNSISINTDIDKACKNAFPTLIATDIRLANTEHSPKADYYYFNQYYYNIPIAGAGVKWIVPHNGDTSWLFGNIYDTINMSFLEAEISVRFDLIHEQLNRLGVTEHIDESKCWYISGNTLSLHRTYSYRFPDGVTYTFHFNRAGELIATEDNRSYFTLPDTTVAGKVFLPDPLTTAGVEYGDDYVDEDDADLTVLNDQRFDVRVPAQLIDGIFYLRTDSLLLKDINIPVIPIASATTDTMVFTRSESGFEDVNTMYHITNMYQYLASIGYEALHNFYLEVDPHGASGADQSFYTGLPFPSIQYGEGGVDDAEDADVIIHELTHAFSDHASPNTNTGLERRAVDEGYGDYFAVSYSRTYSDFLWKNVFSWDGHNEFWFGRNADTDKHYPEDNNDNYYASSEIWSGALMDIFDLIGKEATDRIVCEALYGSFPNMIMPDAAQILLNAEMMLYGGIYHDIMFDALYQRGLVWPVDVVQQNFDNIRITNTLGYASGNEPIFITLETPGNGSWQLFNLDGKLIAEKSFYGSSCAIDVHPTDGQLLLLKVNAQGKTVSTIIANF